ncbi:MAG TPA: dockerin type I repeat-containing protein, partial [candidate division Zixibacteria bacterium]|nr:dockerin type I repeat-containing protein [candidate division Zixibacteria bacterium]
LKMDSVQVGLGEQVVIPVYLHNTGYISDIKFAFQLENHDERKVEYDSFSVAGLRTSYFAYKSLVGENRNTQQFAISLRPTLVGTPDYLPPDTGAIVKLYLTVHTTATPNQLVTIDTATAAGHSPVIVTPYGNYWPVLTVGKVAVRACLRGDANCDGQIKISDLTVIIAYLFQGGPEPDPRGGDVNGDGTIAIADVTYLVNYLFRGGPPPIED